MFTMLVDLKINSSTKAYSEISFRILSALKYKIWISHCFLDWHKAVLLLFGIAILSALTSLCFSFCALCVRICSIVANIFALIAALSSTFALAVFFISSHRNDIRFVQGITRTYEVTSFFFVF